MIINTKCKLQNALRIDISVKVLLQIQYFIVADRSGRYKILVGFQISMSLKKEMQLLTSSSSNSSASFVKGSKAGVS